MSSQEPVQVVCFDLGGVLIRICRSWAEGCHAAGVPVRGESAVADPSGANGRKDLSRLHQTGRMACAQFFRETSEACGGAFRPDEIERIHDAWLLGEYAGVGEVIDRIHDAGVTTAALSNTNLAHWKRMPEFPSFRKLRIPLASHELGMVKPDTMIYREAERRFAATGPQVLFFDDLPDNIAAAESVGWRAVQIDHAGDTARQIERGLREHRVLR